MRRAALALGAAGLLVAPPVVAKFAGGYFAEPRLIVGIVLWALVLALCATGRAPLPRTLAGWLAV